MGEVLGHTEPVNRENRKNRENRETRRLADRRNDRKARSWRFAIWICFPGKMIVEDF